MYSRAFTGVASEPITDSRADDKRQHETIRSERRSTYLSTGRTPTDVSRQDESIPFHGTLESLLGCQAIGREVRIVHRRESLYRWEQELGDLRSAAPANDRSSAPSSCDCEELRTHGGQRVYLTVAIERVITRPALTHLWSAVVHRREKRIDGEIWRAGHRVGRPGKLSRHRAGAGHTQAHD